jgi:Cd2+/Zn2+-exporting ATPase
MTFAPDVANRLVDGVESQVAIDQLQAGDVILIRPSERIAADGIILSGQSTVDESSLTGESIPVEKIATGKVLSGTLNLDGVLTVRVERRAQESTLARMVQLVETAQSSRATAQNFTEWFDHRYPPLVLAVSAVAFVVYLVTLQNVPLAFLRAITIRVSASPCAVVISIPAAVLAAIAGAARGGVLFKGGLTVERLARVNAIAFDKTGTLTFGQPKVQSLAMAGAVREADLLRLAASVERDSEHPFSKAVMHEASQRNIVVPAARDVLVVVGSGISGKVDQRVIRVGKIRWLIAEVGPLPPELQLAIEEHQELAQSAIGATCDMEWLGVFFVADAIRPTADQAIAGIRKLGINKLVMLTGDQSTVAARIAEVLKIEYFAELLPHQKLEQLDQLKHAGFVHAMIGDGMNDAPALAAGDVGIAMGGAGTDVAMETADIVIMADDLRRLPYAIRLARMTQRIIAQNLTFAFAMMLALFVTTLIYPLPLPLAVLAHEGSTVLVILNGLRLLAKRM